MANSFRKWTLRKQQTCPLGTLTAPRCSEEPLEKEGYNLCSPTMQPSLLASAGFVLFCSVSSSHTLGPLSTLRSRCVGVAYVDCWAPYHMAPCHIHLGGAHPAQDHLVLICPTVLILLTFSCDRWILAAFRSRCALEAMRLGSLLHHPLVTPSPRLFCGLSAGYST